MEPPQPNAIPPEGAGAPAQPVEGEQQPAAQPPEPIQSQTPPANDADENFDFEAWLQQKSIDPSTPEGRAAIAKSWRGLEQKMHATTMQASELKKTLTQPTPQPQDGSGVDPVMGEFIQDYRRDKLINGFKDSHPDWNQHEPAMVAKLQETVNTPYGAYTRSQLVNAGFMNLEDVYAMARGSAPVNTEQIQAQAKQEVLQTLANTQRAGGGNAQASNSNPQAPTTDPITEAIRKSRG